MQGFVKWFNSAKGYGFLAGEDGRDYFCHWKNIKEKFDKDGKRVYATLTENTKVRFEVEEKDGREKAMNVVEIEGKDPEKQVQNIGETGEIPIKEIM